MSRALGAHQDARGRSRPRFRAGLWITLASALVLLAGCAGYGPGFAGLPASEGWQRVPLGRWLTNADLGPTRIVYCPAQACTRPAVVATFTAKGEMADRLMRSLADPAALLRPQHSELAMAVSRGARKAAHSRPKSTEHAESIVAGGLKGYRVILSPRVAGGRPAFAVVLARRQGDEAQVAFAITTEPAAALSEAEAAAKSL